MQITIEAESQEIADLVVALQDRQREKIDLDDISQKLISRLKDELDRGLTPATY